MRRPSCVLVVLGGLVAACGRSELEPLDGASPDATAGEIPRDVAAGDRPDTPADRLADTIAATCPDPRGLAQGTRPPCPQGTYAEVIDRNGAPLCELCATCQSECCLAYTGRCPPCFGECSTDADCALVNRRGCLAASCRTLVDCAWAAPRSDLERDPCLYDVRSGGPPPTGAACPRPCSLGADSPSCKACGHCSPDGVACAAGRCIPTWRGCSTLDGCD